MSGAGVRNKGHNGEREFCHILNEALGITDVSRNVDQVRLGGADITAVRPFAIEVKRQERLNLNAWKAQAIKQTTEQNFVAVLVIRENRKPWRVFIDARYLVKKRYAPKQAGVWLEIDLEYFLEIVRKRRV